jgi:hypothetical protein
VAKAVCREVGDPLVNYVAGSGLKGEGFFCSYDPATGNCLTEAVIYDGSGIKGFSETVPTGSYCTGGTFVNFTGSGLSTESHGNWPCSVA